MTDTKKGASPPPPPAPPLAALVARATGLFFALTFLTGVAYPLLVTGAAHAAFSEKAGGSFVVRDGKVRGSRLIGQPFDDPKYFWGRLSATAPFAYNAQSSTGSNLGPTNQALTDTAKARLEALRAADPGNDAPVPADLVTSSGSGLDPHMSPAAADFQARRVARARGLPEARVRALIRANTDDRDLALLGEPGVNVMLLNLALDGLAPSE
jgi:K+-transporting ATPase ATPase C chain